MDLRRTALAWASALLVLGLPVHAQNAQDCAPCRASGNCYPIGHPGRAYSNADEEHIRRLAKIIFESDQEKHRIDAINRLAQIPHCHPDVPRILERASKTDPSMNVRRVAALGIPRYKIAASISSMPYEAEPQGKGFLRASKGLMGSSKPQQPTVMPSHLAATAPMPTRATQRPVASRPAIPRTPASAPAHGAVSQRQTASSPAPQVDVRVYETPVVPSAPSAPVAKVASPSTHQTHLKGTLRAQVPASPTAPISKGVAAKPVSAAPVAMPVPPQPIPVAVKKVPATPVAPAVNVEHAQRTEEFVAAPSIPSEPRRLPESIQTSMVPPTSKVDNTWKPDWRASESVAVDPSAKAKIDESVEQVQFLQKWKSKKKAGTDVSPHAEESATGSTDKEPRPHAKSIPVAKTPPTPLKVPEQIMVPADPAVNREPEPQVSVNPLPSTPTTVEEVKLESLQDKATVIEEKVAEYQPISREPSKHLAEEVTNVAAPSAPMHESSPSTVSKEPASEKNQETDAPRTNPSRSVFTGLVDTLESKESQPLSGRRTVRIMKRQPETTNASISASAAPATVRKTTRIMAKLPSRTVLIKEGESEEALASSGNAVPMEVHSSPELTPAPLSSIQPTAVVADKPRSEAPEKAREEDKVSRPPMHVSLSAPIPIANHPTSSEVATISKDSKESKAMPAAPAPVPPAPLAQPVVPPPATVASATAKPAAIASPVTTTVQKPLSPVSSTNFMADAPAKPASAVLSGKEAIEAAQSKRLLSADKLPTGIEERKAMAKQMMQECKQLIKEGKFDQAEMQVYRVRELAIDYGVFEESPRDLMIQIGNARLRHMRKSN